MLSPGKIYINTVIAIPVKFIDSDENPVDPSSVTFKLCSPCGVISSYAYSVDAQITKASTGNYVAEVQPDTAGRWRFRWETTGTGTTTALEGDFLVQVSPFFDDCCSGDYCRW